MSLTIVEELPKRLRLSCFHDAGGEGQVSVHTELGRPMEMDIMRFYEEALGRLPIADMPEVLSCVVRGGHCIGLLDPVSNIIFNALNLLCRRRCSGNVKGKRPSGAQVGGKRKGEGEAQGLIAFMRIYFRYLSQGQAMCYLRLAGADLAVAVQLGENQQFGPEDRRTTGAPDLHCGRTQFALKVAAAVAGHPVPDDLVRLAKLLVPLRDHDRTPLAAVLEKGRPLETTTSVSSGCNTTLPGGQVLEAGERPARFFCPMGENHVAEVVVSRRRDGHVSSICDLRTPDKMKQMLLDCLDAAAITIGKHSPPHMEPSTTACQCEHTRYLKVCLADTIHALYIKAVSLLPHNALHRHLRGILVAGHCYGPMDPVSNIILSAIWYDSVCPLLEIDAVTEPDILDAQSMLRMVVSSVDSLVAMVCTATGFWDHMAVEYLCYKQCDLSKVLQMATKEVCYKAYVCAGQAGKHPKHLELASFLMSMADNVPKDTLLTHEAMEKGCVISDAALEQVYKIMEDQSSSTAPKAMPIGLDDAGIKEGRIRAEADLPWSSVGAIAA